MNYSIKRRDTQTPARIVDAINLLQECATLSENGRHALDVVEIKPTVAPSIDAAETIPAPPADETPADAAPVNSTWTHTVVDETAKARIEAQHAALNAAGIKVDTSEQLYSTGTRMADVGYSTQHARKAEHDAKMAVRDACAGLVAMVADEKREDRKVSAREFADAITANGKISVFGHALSVQAIRGLMARTESPALGYVLGVQERCAARVAANHAGKATDEAVQRANHADIAEIATVLRHECMQASGETLKLRLRAVGRNGRPDCYAVVGPDYAPADATAAVPQLADQLPRDARASFSYDVASTTWELRASVWTPTEVSKQAVGEAFEGYVSFQSRDNGTSRFRGGGGVTLLRCLNASTYVADDSSVARVHRGRILYAIERMLRGGLRSIDALTRAWGTNREAILEMPTAPEGKRAPTLEEAIPGFYMSMLRSKQSELVGVLPGRTRDHSQGLAKAYFAERRDPEKLVRSDLAQGWTRYIQTQPSDVRRDAETAIGEWLVNNRPVKCDLADRI
jgi:hypothetical protein